MSRSKHTDPRPIRAVRRGRAPFAGRQQGDLSARRRAGLVRKQAAAATAGEHGREQPREQRRKQSGKPSGKQSRKQGRRPLLRIVVRRPRRGFHHPAGRRDVLAMLRAVGPAASYGLRSVELGRSPASGEAMALRFGRYQVPGKIVLFEQPLPPWRLPALVPRRDARRLERAGATLTRMPEVGAMLVDWPPGTLRRFMLAEVLLHELGHHLLQHERGKRPVRIARTRDHEAFARRVARRLRAALGQREP
jgi:hypothetical protein